MPRYVCWVPGLKDALIGLGVSAADLDALEVWPAYRGLGLAERVYRSGLVGDARLVEAFVGLGAVDATATVLGAPPLPAALGAFSRALAERHRALPLQVERKRLIVALLDPGDTATLEQLSFICGLVIEPRACRPRVLFEGLASAYDVAVVRPESAFLDSRRPRPPGADDDGFNLPPPSTDAGAHFVAARVDSNRFAKADLASPMARVLAEVAEAGDTAHAHAGDAVNAVNTHGTFGLLSTPSVRDLRPARSGRLDEEHLRKIVAMPVDDARRARDALPPLALGLLVPPLRCCALFLVDDNVAVGWDVRTVDGHLDSDVVRDVLLPLTAESVLADAVRLRRVAVGNARSPSTMERTLFRLLRVSPPRSFAALPVLVGQGAAAAVVAVLYADTDEGELSSLDFDDLRRVGTVLGDALAPLVAAGVVSPRDKRPATDR